MTEENEKISVRNYPPRFFSTAFHTHFFPLLLLRHLRPKKEEYQSLFSNHVPMEFMILTFISIIAGVTGLTAGFCRGSTIGLGFGILGVAGFLTLLIHSIRSQRGTRPSFDSFRLGIFFFFVVLGITVGIFAGSLQHSFWLGFWVGIFGFFVGYGVGIYTGLWMKCIGWIGALFDHLAVAAIVGLIVLDCVLLSFLFF